MLTIMKHQETKIIRISVDLYNKLNEVGRKNESYAHLLDRLVLQEKSED